MSIDPVDRWIPVKDHLPKRGQDVLATYDDGVESRLIPANYDDGWFDCCFNREVEPQYIKAWMPLPEPYKEENNG